MKRPAKLQRLYQIFPLLKLDTTKKRGVTLLYTISRGGFFLAKNTAGENPASFGTDWTVKSARRSDVRKRPRILLPAFQPVRKRWTLECQPRHHFRGLDTCSN